MLVIVEKLKPEGIKKKKVNLIHLICPQRENLAPLL